MDITFLLILSPIIILGIAFIVVGWTATKKIETTENFYVVRLWVIKMFGREKTNTIIERHHLPLLIIGLFMTVIALIALIFQTLFHTFH